MSKKDARSAALAVLLASAERDLSRKGAALCGAHGSSFDPGDAAGGRRHFAQVDHAYKVARDRVSSAKDHIGRLRTVDAYIKREAGK